MNELIKEIAILAEELSKELTHPDPVARLYSVMMQINRAIGERMWEIRDERNNISK